MKHDVNTNKFIRISPDEYERAKNASAAMKNHMWELVSTLAPKNPDWTFVLCDGWGTAKLADGRDVIAFSSFKVVNSDGETLGKVSHDMRYSSAQGAIPAYVIQSKHLGHSGNRHSKKTTKLDVAMREIKKAFRPDTQKEKVAEAKSEADSVVYDSVKKKSWERDRLLHRVVNKAYEYVMSTHRDEFYVAMDKDTQQNIDKCDELAMEIKTIEDVKQNIDDKNYYLIIKDGNKYIVRVDDNVKLCDDSSLPQDARSKLGMLKLVNTTQFVENVGCRVTEDTFVVVKGEADEHQT